MTSVKLSVALPPFSEKLGADRLFETEPAPASSLYHIVAAYRQLRETMGGLGEP